MQLTYASAGHPPPRLVRGENVTAFDSVVGLPLGIDESQTYNELSITLEQRDLLVIHTDGITEAMRNGPGGSEYFQTHRLDRVLLQSSQDRACDCVDRISKAVNDFSGSGSPTDDQTLLVVRVQ